MQSKRVAEPVAHTPYPVTLLSLSPLFQTEPCLTDKKGRVWDHRRMILSLDMERGRTLDEVRAFLDGSAHRLQAEPSGGGVRVRAADAAPRRLHAPRQAGQGATAARGGATRETRFGGTASVGRPWRRGARLRQWHHAFLSKRQQVLALKGRCVTDADCHIPGVVLRRPRQACQRPSARLRPPEPWRPDPPAFASRVAASSASPVS